MNRRELCAAGITAGASMLAPSGRAAYASAIGSPASLDATRGDGTAITLGSVELREFSRALRGELLLPRDPGYDSARRVWNGMIDRRPALIARCAGAADIRAAVDFARSHELLVAVRGGGHSISGKSVCDGGLMIDLSAMRSVRIDPVTRTARVEPGVLLGALDREALAFGLVTTAGTVSHTGAAGLTLGGGFGRTGRLFGLTCDNLAAADVVLADGRFTQASASNNADLLWGLRGGGGNFGVVSSFEYQLHPMDPVIYGGTVAYPLDQAVRILLDYAEFCAEAPDALNTDWALIAPAGRPPMLQLEACFAGPAEAGEVLVSKLARFGKPLVNRTGPMEYLRLQQRIDATVPHGGQYYMKSGFLRGIPVAAAETLVGNFRPSQHMTQVITLQQLGGAIGRVPQTATAFSHRDASHSLLVMAGWKEPGRNPEHIREIRDYWSGLEAFTTGFYVNSITADDEPKLRSNYRENYARLVQLKNRYDPGNLFRMNANVQPDGQISRS